MCTCASCSYTDKFAGKGFAEWPRGEPAGPRSSAAAYAAHVAHSFHGAIKRKPINMDPVSYYGTSGTTRAEVLRVLRQQFGLEPMPEKPEAPKPILTIVPQAPKPSPIVADDLAEFVRRQLAA